MFHDCVLGNFQKQLIWWCIPGAYRTHHQIDDILLGDAGRLIDGDQKVTALATDCSRLTWCCIKRPQGEGQNQCIFLGAMEELVWIYNTLLRMISAYQRLDTGKCLGGKVYLWLIVDLQFIP